MNISNAISGSFNMGTSHKISEQGFGFQGVRIIPIKKKLLGMSNEIWVGGKFKYSSVTYTSHSLKRHGFHLQLGIDSSWRFFPSKKFYLAMDLSFYPLDQVSLFSKVNSFLNDDRISNTSETKLTGIGFGLGLSGGYSLSFKVLRLKVNMEIAPQLIFNMISFNSRTDRVIISNQSTGAVEVSQSSSGTNATANYLCLGLRLNFLF